MQYIAWLSGVYVCTGMDGWMEKGIKKHAKERPLLILDSSNEAQLHITIGYPVPLPYLAVNVLNRNL